MIKINGDLIPLNESPFRCFWQQQIVHRNHEITFSNLEA